MTLTKKRVLILSIVLFSAALISSFIGGAHGLVISGSFLAFFVHLIYPSIYLPIIFAESYILWSYFKGNSISFKKLGFVIMFLTIIGNHLFISLYFLLLPHSNLFTLFVNAPFELFLSSDLSKLISIFRNPHVPFSPSLLSRYLNVFAFSSLPLIIFGLILIIKGFKERLSKIVYFEIVILGLTASVLVTNLLMKILTFTPK